MKLTSDLNDESLEFIVNGITFKMIKVEGGDFIMGATPEQGQNYDENEVPTHSVTLSDYYIGQVPVTRELWKAVMGVYPDGFDGWPDHPVVHISWDNVVNDFLPKLNAMTGKTFTLPTEAQWEFAARGGNKSKGYKCSGSHQASRVGFCSSNFNDTNPVGQYKANELDLYDMSGNVWEWCSDQYGDYVEEPQVDPTGAAWGGTRVVRGGSASSPTSSCRVACRNSYDTMVILDNVGFRLALSGIISLNKENLNLIPGKTETLIAGVNGVSPFDVAKTWRSSDSSVVSVDSDGRVTGVAPGSAVITVKMNDTGKECNCNIEVLDGINIIANGIDIPLIKIDGGTFTMGATREQWAAAEDEEPAHDVTLSDYYIGQFLVTKELWHAVMGESVGFGGKNPSLPACSTWDDLAKIFLPKLNAMTGKTFTLPTEAQWEFAARGGNKSKGYIYSGSDNLTDVGWSVEECFRLWLYPIGQKLPNELGIYDMSSNGLEWCADRYADYGEIAQTDPIALDSGKGRVLRGGENFTDTFRECGRVSRRAYGDPFQGKGCFRLVLTDMISFDKAELMLTQGKSEILSVGLNGMAHSNTKLIWTTSDPSVAAVDSHGQVTAVSPGSAVITAREDNTGKECKCNIKVLDGINITVNGIDIPMVKIDGGTFTMGASHKQSHVAPNIEESPYQVTLSDYYIGQFQVTQELWESVMGFNPSQEQNNPQNPIDKVTWDDVVNDFLPKLNALTGRNFTLPSEAQWEFAARGGNKSSGFDDKMDLRDYSWYKKEGVHPVGQKLPNELGLYDMLGNGDEWCSNYCADYSPQPQTDPLGPFAGDNGHVMRSSLSISGRAPLLKAPQAGFRLTISDIISFKFESFMLLSGQSKSLKVFINGITLFNSGLTWISSDTSVANVDSDGNVTAIGSGSAVIYARANDTGKETSCIVNVSDAITVNVNGIDISLIKVEGGTFTMKSFQTDSKNNGNQNFYPHRVTLSDYYIGQYEVTEDLWEAVMGENACPSHGPKYAVQKVSWNDIVNGFLPKLNALTGKNFTLPTEAQWEFAARERNMSQENYFEYPAPNFGEHMYTGSLGTQVGKNSPNTLGLFDMQGNVYEWCSDKSGSWSLEPQIDPLGPSSNDKRVIKEMLLNSSGRRVMKHYSKEPDKAFDSVGFRLALSDKISLNKDHIILRKGQSETLKFGPNGIVTLSGGLKWSSSDSSVAIVDTAGKVTAVSKGSAVITVSVDDAVQAFSCHVDVLDGFSVNVNGIDISLIKVEGGTFTMGTTSKTASKHEDNSIEHQVTVSDYYISQFQVTHELWKAVMGENSSSNVFNPHSFASVTWNEIVDHFIPRLNALTGKKFTLPTEAQWEYAARGGNRSNGFVYAGSNIKEDVTLPDSYDDSVGMFPPNELGLYDMTGEVWEWCSDWYGDYKEERQTDPTGPSWGAYRVLRAGEWGDYLNSVSDRSYSSPDLKDGFGFRLAVSDTISMNKETTKLLMGKSETLKVGYNGIISLNGSIAWRSSDPSIATVDMNGKVTAENLGSVVITALVDDIGKELSCNVEVIPLTDPSMIVTVNDVAIPLIKVEGGTFMMGQAKAKGLILDSFDEEDEVHQVTLSDYYIGQFAVTQKLWEAVMGCKPPCDQENPENPVVGVSLNNVLNDFLPKLNAMTGKTFTLPTEAQWEFAARGGNKSKGYFFSGSADLKDVAWCNAADPDDTGIHPVGQKLPNELGIYDMSGNVYERCSDCYDDYQSEPQTDPIGGDENYCGHVIRGGSYNEDNRFFSVSHREVPRTDIQKLIGFRLVLWKKPRVKSKK